MLGKKERLSCVAHTQVSEREENKRRVKICQDHGALPYYCKVLFSPSPLTKHFIHHLVIFETKLYDPRHAQNLTRTASNMITYFSLPNPEGPILIGPMRHHNSC